MSSAGLLYFGATSSGNNTLTNAAGGTLNLSGTYGTPIEYYTGTATFNNAGTLNHTVAGTHAINSNVTFNNTGTVNVSAGTLSINGSGTDTGTYSASAGSGLQFWGRYADPGVRGRRSPSAAAGRADHRRHNVCQRNGDWHGQL
ncbi:MAG: hypothetical protein IPG23_24870 [Burkholderiales bacterium]|nr:hypothetical protein [Burkholderiales bacterium]